MDINFNYISTEQLAELYLKADKELEKALISGATWEDIKDKRRIVTELAIELHKKRNPEDFGSTPADTQIRKGQ
jgi:hypothetical protein